MPTPINMPGLPDLPTYREQVQSLQANLTQLSRIHGRVHNLARHIDVALLLVAGAKLRLRAAAGVDKESPKSYRRYIVKNTHRIILEVKHKSYQPDPARRVSIPKDDGTERHLGIPTVRDKHLQRGVQLLLEAIYEPHFYPHSYGFRPHRSARMAISVLRDWLVAHDGAHVLEIDLSKFFDTIPHDRLMDILSERTGDKVILHLIHSWLKAGTMVDGVLVTSDRGTPQGSAISPLLANVHLDTALDRWFMEIYRPTLRKESFLVRYADDFVLAFEDAQDAEQAQLDITNRLEQFGLRVNLKKTHLTDMRKPQGDPTGEINFLGFTYYWKHCPVTGWRMALRTSDKSIARFSERLTTWITSAGDISPEEQDARIHSMVRGHRGYFAQEGNEEAISHVESLARRARAHAPTPGTHQAIHNDSGLDPKRIQTPNRRTKQTHATCIASIN